MTDDPAFTIVRPPSSSVPIVVHAPHGGRTIPPAVREQLLLDDPLLEVELLRMTDHHTDRFAEELATGTGCVAFVNGVSRLVVDPERFLDPSDEEMEAVGMGAVYTRTHDQRPLRRADRQHRRALLDRYFRPYSQALTELVEEIVDQHGRCTLLDLHSYPSTPLPYELHGDGERPEICLGTDAFHTPSELVDGVREAARRDGFTVALDTPFAGTYVPTRHFRRDVRVRSLMIEIRRDTYVDEQTGTLRDGRERIAHFLTKAVATATP